MSFGRLIPILALGAVFAINSPMVNAHAQSLTVSMAQIFCLDGDRRGNFARIENAIVEAKAAGAQLVAFPESCLLGWENPVAHKRACPIPGIDSDRLCALARKYSIYLSIGLDEKEGDRLYDSCVLIDDQGRILLKHRKVNVLPELMSPPYAVGDGNVQAVDTRYGRIGMLICADSFRPELLTRMKERRPDLLLIPYGWAAPEDKWPDHGQNLKKVVLQVAAAVGCPVVGTDLVGEVTYGPWAGQVYGGQSVAASSDGAVLARGRDRDRDIVTLAVQIPSRAP